ncbi:tripartite tricarboxylate transporter TctB family protein [Pseudonocardia nantongensis]|uniref:tripartite tricarboxylate transporter TctB family protein n=1 Tax=Pseudonocardia nantongensis TaxID=1181885 RepID=UPI003979CED3
MTDARSEATHIEGDPVHPEVEDRRELRASVVLGLIMLAAAVLVLVDAARLPAADDAVGPATVPFVVGVLLGSIGAALAVRARLRLAAAPEGPPRPRNGAVRVTVMVLALVAFALVLPLLGYVVSSAALFTVTALLLGAPGPVRTIGYGWALAAIVFLLFDRLIGLTLPTGPWGF